MEENCPPERQKKIQYDKNPFIDEVLSQLKETVKVKREFVNGDRGVTNILSSSDGKQIGETALIHYKKVDTEQFTKLYSNKVKNFFSMTTAANLVFEYILINLKPNQDQIYLYEKDITGFSGLSARSCLRGTEWLLENKIIARTTRPYWFYINPTLFFNGDRLTLVEVYERNSPPPTPKKQLPENNNFLTNQIPNQP